ncbi:MAG TPA: hypothetical protein DCZ01_12345 [Elusimicrobia bacterium]|nr:MAG: hypothetical protein A2X40_02195 [Elusimicrobia bacterium GWC2_65_9]HAZ09278.1 hypothetical protein [Elusimicrobiota bacterium]
MTRPEWFWETTAEADWEPAQDDFLAYITQAFERSEIAFRGFSNAQIAQGLRFLISPSCSDGMFALKDDNIPWLKRQGVVRAIRTLFRDCFAKRCSSKLSHLDEKNLDPLNGVCYIWWDVFPIYGAPQNTEQKDLDHEILAVMQSTLELNHVACQESALHGLGHWSHYYQDRVEKIIDQFLTHNEKLRPELRQYALQASAGRVQ